MVLVLRDRGLGEERYAVLFRVEGALWIALSVAHEATELAVFGDEPARALWNLGVRYDEGA
jgi:hypothetical protein